MNSMDSNEATNLVFSRIQSLEPDNATKIMGYLLLKDYGEKEMIRFALGPDTLLRNLIFEAKTQLGLPTKSPSTPSSPFLPISRPNPLSLSSSRITNNAFDFKNSSSLSSNTCPLSGFSVSRRLNNPPVSSSSFPSYASVLNRSSDSGSGYLSSPKVSSSSTGYNSSSVTHDEYLLQNDLSFLNDSKVDLYGSRVDFASNPDTNCNNLHNPNNYSVPGTLLGAEDLNSGFGWKPCLYFARGFCKNGSSCRFLHEGSTTDGAAIVGSPINNLKELEQCQELLRLKSAAQRQKPGSESPFETGTSFPYKNCLNFLMQQEVDNQR